MTQEFLPLCDVLFNIISLASYFCDVVFDLITVYTLYERRQFAWFGVALGCVAASLLASQVLSVRWHLRERRPRACGMLLLGAIHILQGGVLWRYFQLFVPVELRHVKRAVRDLCLLRLTHAFCEAAPMLLVQLHFVWAANSAAELTQLNLVSALLSLFSVCWALASFNKHIRQRNLHKLVLTWLGVIYQFLWRLGTVSSRVVALSLYATLYHFWVFLVIGLHWASMFLWLVAPKNVFHGERLPRAKKGLLALLISYVYVFCYVNLQEANGRQKMAAFYVTMFLENTLLMTVWLGQQAGEPWFKYAGVAAVWGGFAFGITFMVLYYRYFHVRRLEHGRQEPKGLAAQAACPACRLGSCSEHSELTTLAYLCSETSVSELGKGLAFRHPGGEQNGVAYIPGVFNCRLNPAFKRKKKKPTTFIPVPVPPMALRANGRAAKKAEVPFWKRPLPRDDADAGPRVDIQQKLQEKKRQQLQELRVIEEEIKQGKLQRPHPTDISEQGTLRQPIPKAKKQPWGQRGAPKFRSKTPEVLLAPHYLEHTRIYYDYGEEKWRFAPQLPAVAVSAAPDPEAARGLYKSCRTASDLDSQVSLPRSYTLPREFRYHRKPKARRTLRPEHFVTSTNSSDGDVDSGDENETGGVQKAYRSPQPPLGVVRARPPGPGHCGAPGYNLHETKL